MFGSLVDYWYYTGDDTYNEITTQALLHQVGPEQNYEPPNQTSALGNDDQAFWGMAALSAAEYAYPNPPEDKPQWLALAQAVYNAQVSRWNNETCAGGLNWQVVTYNKGYNYKNTISNGGFFNIASRLARYTGEEMYAEWAVKMWDWVEAMGLFSPTYQFFDGTDEDLNCTNVNHIQWSYNAGIFLMGAANMFNYVSTPAPIHPAISRETRQPSNTNLHRPTAKNSGKLASKASSKASTSSSAAKTPTSSTKSPAKKTANATSINNPSRAT